MQQDMIPVNVTLDSNVLAEIDILARRLNLTRDEILRSATQKLLAVNNVGTFLNRKQVAEMLGVSVPTVTAMTKRRKSPLPHTRLSVRKVVFYEPEVRLWAKTQ